MSDELWRCSALEQARLVRERTVTSEQLVGEHLDRIARVNPAINAVVRLVDDAIDAAREADRRLAAGETVGPLHGVPITVKDNIDMVGQPTTQGIPALAEAVPPRDAPIVERMRAAGAIPIARTNLPDLGLRVHTDSTLYGATRNPWNPGRTPGGSSGGEAAAIATGMSPLGLGNDIGGSLRNPAHCCGIASIKPSTGVVADAQTFPMEDFGLSAQLMLNQGVLARRVADVRAGLLAVAGADPRDPVSVPVVLADAPTRARVAVLAEPPGGSTDPAVAAIVRDAAERLASAGHEVFEAVPPDFELACELWRAQMNGELTPQLELLDAVMGEGGRRFLHLSRATMPDVDLAAWGQAQVRRNGVARRWSTWFTDVDVLVLPVWTEPAYEVGTDVRDADGARRVLELIRPVLPANLLGLPAAVVPGGATGGLPVGVQVVSARYRDLTALAVAEAIESGNGVMTPIDPVS